MMGVQIFEPRDDAMPAAEGPALPQMTRELQSDRVVLQRESTVEGSSTAIFGYLAILLVALLLLGALGWGIWRISKPLTDEQREDGSSGNEGTGSEGSGSAGKRQRPSGPLPSPTPGVS